MVKGLLMASAAVLVMASCSVSGKTGKSEAEYLGGRWNVTELKGENMIYGNTLPYVVMNIADSTVSGNAGCNMMNGRITLEGENGLSFGPVATTRMMCPEADVETSLLAALDGVRAFEVARTGENVDSVMLKSADGEVLVKLMKRNDIDGRWTVSKSGDRTVETQERVPFLDFRMNAGRVFGNLGCNSYNASVELDEAASKISFGMGAMTQMMCPDADIERELVAVLSEVVSYRINAEKGSLELLGSDGSVLMLLER